MNLELQYSHFNRLETALIDNNATIALLEFYTTLLRHWTCHLLADLADCANGPGDGVETTVTLDPPSTSKTTTLALTSAITSLTTHSSLLVLTLLTTHRSSSQVLNYLETLSLLISQAASQPALGISVPHPLIIYLLTFMYPSISTLSRLCSVLATHKLAFEATVTRPRVSPAGSEKPQAGVLHKYSITHFNGFLMDICNLLWRSRAFNRTDPNALGCLLPPSVLPYLANYTSSLKPPYLLNTSFSLGFHPVLAGLSNAAMREFEEREIEARGEKEIRVRHAGPVTQKSLLVLGREGGVVVGWKDYRLAVLSWLETRGLGGLSEFMGCTMKGLMGKGESGGTV
jgi:centromere protein I